MVLSNFRNKCHTLRRNFIMKIQIFSLFLVLALHSHLRGEAGPRIELQQDNSLRGSAVESDLQGFTLRLLSMYCEEELHLLETIWIFMYDT